MNTEEFLKKTFDLANEIDPIIQKYEPQTIVLYLSSRLASLAQGQENPSLRFDELIAFFQAVKNQAER